jgi:predicted RNA-binding Zn ribbon-like protein
VRVDRFDAGRQPAGRAPAPGRLAFVQAFLNTFWDLDAHGAERWVDARAYGGWLSRRGFAGAAVAGADLARAIELREALRALALANHDDAPAPGAEATLDRIAAEVAPRAGLTPRFASSGGGDRLDVTADGPDAALALVLGIVFAARADGTWRRLKACPHAHCGWAFYDRSRNRSSQWCSMRLCGNRTKGARHRRRAAPARRPVR